MGAGSGYTKSTVGPTVGATMGLLNPSLVEILPQGLNVCGELTGEDLALSETDTAVQGPLIVNLDLTNADSTVYATGSLSGTILRQCVRCLKEYEDPLDLWITAIYVRQVGIAAHPAKSSAPDKRRKGLDAKQEEADDDEDAYLYEGDQLDLAPMLREQVILSAPMQPLCQEDCRGLCVQCGENLNVRQCQCATEPVNTPFRVLQDRKKPSGGGAAS